MVTGPNEVVVRWQISDNYYLYKKKFIFSTKDFYIEDVNFPAGALKFDEFFGLSEIYYNVMETTLHISPTISGITMGILEVAYQRCWEGGVCYPLARKSLHIRDL
jgi:Thiol:disulfide interchange protein